MKSEFMRKMFFESKHLERKKKLDKLDMKTLLDGVFNPEE